MFFSCFSFIWLWLWHFSEINAELNWVIAFEFRVTSWVLGILSQFVMSSCFILLCFIYLFLVMCTMAYTQFGLNLNSWLKITTTSCSLCSQRKPFCTLSTVMWWQPYSHSVSSSFHVCPFHSRRSCLSPISDTRWHDRTIPILDWALIIFHMSL